jgi:putative phage-type endonuclease
VVVVVSAIEIVPVHAGRDSWLAARRHGLGASEIAAVLGISPWESPFSLYWRKANDWQTDTNAEMSTGTFLEAVIADWFAANRDPLENLVFDYAGLYAHPDRPWQLATPDRLIYLRCAECDGGDLADPWAAACLFCGGRGYQPDLSALLECKWVAASWDGWGEDRSDIVPVYYRAQVQWQMDVMDVPEVFVCALGPTGFRTYRIRRDERDLAVMREHGARFMRRLADGDPPDIDDHAATLAIVKRLHADIDDVDVEIDPKLAAGYLRSRRFKRLAAALGERYDIALRHAMGTGRKAVCGGKTVATRTASDALQPARSKK